MEPARFFRVSPEEFDLLRPLFPQDADERLRQLRAGEIDVYAVARHGAPVGRLVANYHNQHLAGETIPGVRAHLSHFILLREHRGQGLGTALLRFALDDLAARGWREWTVGVEAANAVARHIYAQCGFTEWIDRGHTPCEYDLYLRKLP